MHAKLLCKIDGDFSCLSKVDPTRERIIQSGYFVAAYMDTWNKLGLSVTPKEHIFEDHAIESTQAINSLGDNT